MPEPPRMEAPPIKQAAIASSSPPTPAEGEPAAERAVVMMPAQAHISPISMNTISFTRLTLTPDSRLASTLPPTA
ncbi:hypothetical protein D3C73_1630560 [compost metagenome]